MEGSCEYIGYAYDQEGMALQLGLGGGLTYLRSKKESCEKLLVIGFDWFFWISMWFLWMKDNLLRHLKKDCLSYIITSNNQYTR